MMAGENEPLNREGAMDTRRGRWCNSPLPGGCYRAVGTSVSGQTGAECARCGLLTTTVDAVSESWEPLE